MNRATALCLAAVCLLTAGSAVHADSISYNFSPDSTQFSLNNGTINAIRLLNTAGTLPISTTPTSIHTDFAAVSLGAGTVSTPVDLTLSGSANPVMLGTISGLVWKGGSDLSFTPVNNGNPVTTKAGGSTFTISYSSLQQASGFGVTGGQLNFTIVDPPNPSGTTGGTTTGTTGGTTGSPTSSTPEPSSLVLAGIGIPVLGVFLRRRRAAKKKL